MVIISLFQEDNIFGTSASLTYGPQLQLQILPFVIGKWKVFAVYTEQMRSPYTENAGAGLPTLLIWRMRYDLFRIIIKIHVALTNVIPWEHWMLLQSLQEIW